MAKYVVFFRFTADTVNQLVESPGDRPSAVRALAESVGGRMESYYLMFGHWDGLVVIDVPDSHTAAAISLAVTSSRAFQQLETHELIDPADFPTILAKAKSATYAPPGG